MKCLLKDANMWKDTYDQIISAIYKNCETCLRFNKTPPKPVVCLPLAKSFNETVAMDLKVWSHNLYILYLIDMFTRYTKAAFIHNKKLSTIVDKVMLMWVGCGMGAPKGFLADNAGEFANEEYRDM